MSKWGGKKESNSLTILQDDLFLNTFLHDINIVQTPQNSHESLRTPTSVSTCDQVQKYNFYAKGKFPLYFKAFLYRFETLISLPHSQILTKLANSFSTVVTELILNLLPIQNILFCKGTSPINLIAGL